MKKKSILVKNLLLLSAFLFCMLPATGQNGVAINTDGSAADGKAMLDIKSTTKGVLIPRMTTAQRTVIASPPSGLMVYDTDIKAFYYYDNSDWHKVLMGGGSTNYTDIGSDGTVSLNGTATTWNDLVVNPNMAKGSGTGTPTWELYLAPNIYSWSMPDAVDDELDFTVQLPHNYKVNSTMYPHVHWAPATAAGTNRVLFELDYYWVNLGDAFTSYSTVSGYNVIGETAGAAPSRSLVANESCITPMPNDRTGISGSGKGISSILLCRLRRKGSDSSNDTYTGKVFILSIDFHYEIDAFGSSSEYTK